VNHENPLTYDGHDDDGEVEHVPRVLEVIVTQSDELNEALGSEDCHEDNVDIVKNILKVTGRLVVLDSHCKHVQQDHYHNENVKLLICCQFEDGQSALQLHSHVTQT